MKHIAKIGICNKVDRVCLMTDDMSDNAALQHTKDITNFDNWVMANDKVGIGYSYNDDTGIFTAPKPYPSWVLNTSDNPNFYECPVSKPEDLDNWNEASQAWE